MLWKCYQVAETLHILLSGCIPVKPAFCWSTLPPPDREAMQGETKCFLHTSSFQNGRKAVNICGMAFSLLEGVDLKETETKGELLCATQRERCSCSLFFCTCPHSYALPYALVSSVALSSYLAICLYSFLGTAKFI